MNYLTQEIEHIINHLPAFKISDIGEAFGPFYTEKFEVVKTGDNQVIMMTLEKRFFMEHMA